MADIPLLIIRALENLHIGENGIPIAIMTEAIIPIVEARPAMKVLCAVPFRDKTITELDVSSQRLGVEGALVIRRYLETNGALTSLNISNNRLCGIWTDAGGYKRGTFDGSGKPYINLTFCPLGSVGRHDVVLQA